MNDLKDYEIFKEYNSLGGIYPFYSENNKKIFSLDIGKIIEKLPKENRIIDEVGLIEIVSKSFLFSNRTLVKRVKRIPWMAKPSKKGNNWEYANIPKHGYIKDDSIGIYETFKKELTNDICDHIKEKKNIGILLSGGLDSRIVAGIVKQLQIDHKFCGDVVALTWGIKNCRDIVYAEEISRRFKWEFIKFELNADILRDNIFISGKMGAQFSPIHLHAMPKIAELKGIDIIIAGSYGDSVGRAEFSGKHITKLQRTVPLYLNKFGLINNQVIKNYKNYVLYDAYNYRKYIKREIEYQYREIEQEMHYMRCKLNSCMNVISKSIPLYQAYVSPKVFSIMWGLHPKIRDSRYYKKILKQLPCNIGNIPWARTGISIICEKNVPDSFLKLNNYYGTWLREDLKDFIIELVKNGEIMKLKIFNEKSIDNLIAIWQKAETKTHNSIDEIISWLASLSVFIRYYDIKPSEVLYSLNFKDKLNSIVGNVHANLYQKIREKIRD